MIRLSRIITNLDMHSTMKYLMRILFLLLLCSPLLPGYVIAGQDQLDSLMAQRSQTRGMEKFHIEREIARQYVRINPDSADHYIDLLRDYTTSENDPVISAYILKLEGLVAVQALQYELAMSKYREAYSIFRQLNNQEEMGWTARGIGRSFFYLGSYDNAMENFLMSLSAFEQAGKDEGIAGVHNDLGAVCYVMGHLDKALDYYETALDLYTEMEKEKNKFRIYNNMGIIYFDQEQYEKSLEFYFRAVKILTKENDFSSLAGTYNNIALCYSNLEQLETALMYIRRAIKLARESSNRYTDISARLNLGVIHSRMNRPDSALIYLETTLAEADTLELKDIKAECFNELAQHHERYGDYRRAYEAHRNFFVVHNEIHNESSQSRIDNLMAGYEQKLKQQELAQLKADQETQALVNKIFALMIGISLVLLIMLIYGYSNKRRSNRLLEEKNTELSDVNERLTQSEASLRRVIEGNNKLFSIVAHDLRNPVAAVSGFSELMYDNYEHLDDSTRKEYLSQIIQGSTRTHDLLENLLLWARSQMNAVNIKPKIVPVRQLIEESVLSVQIAMDHKKIRLETSFEQEFSLDADPDMIKAVIRNLLTNAVKFSFPDRTVELRCFRSDDLGCIAVSDHGIGMQPEVLNTLFDSSGKISTPGTTGETGSGLGLLICKDYTEMSGGTIKAESQPARGTTITVCFPVSD